MARKYSRIFVHGHYLFRERRHSGFKNWGINYPRIFPSFCWGVFAHVTRLDQSRASKNIGWIITTNGTQHILVIRISHYHYHSHLYQYRQFIR